MWNKKYDVDHYIYGTEPNEFLAQSVKAIPKGRVLCLAEGEGRNAVFLAKQGYDVTAVDASDVALQKAEKLAQDNQVRVDFILSDLGDYDFGVDRWDGIVSIFCHIPKEIRLSIHPKVVRGLKIGGTFILEAYTPKQLKHGTGGGSEEGPLMTADNLKQELHGLEFRHLKEIERNVIEGTYHTGIGAVVQAIATK